ncbi:BLUF domain-containing protein [Nocardioides sp.]|uniref:BLUF domain-containing protein n=1 Tax=Nocardioides sp. TaxID=35761 RepID=UPI00321BF768
MLSLTYLSSAVSPWSEGQLTELLVQARAKNEARGVTGVLLYHGGNFIQTIEGPDDVVLSTFGTVELDLRHRGVIVVLQDQIDEREFPDWSMGFRSLTNEGADSLLGPTGYVTSLRRGERGGQGLSRAEVFHRVFRESTR